MLWRIPMIIQVIPAVLLFIGMTFLSETPRWLCAHHKYGQAYQVLSKMRGVEDVKVEMDQIQSSVELEAMGQSASSWKHIFAIENRKRLLIGCSLQGFQQMTGTNLINYFSPIIFRSIGLPSRESELLATGVYGLLKMAVVLIGFSNLIDRYGRRPLLIGGGVALGICMYIVSFCMSRTEMDGGIPSPSTGSLSSTAIIVS
jgi:SP family sugar:H+ symporter-like MFS transporter